MPVVQILAVFFMSRALQMWNTSVMDAAGKPHVGMILNALVLIALPPSIWLGSEFGVAGCRGRLQPRRAALRRDPVVRADDARALPDAAERARASAGDRALSGRSRASPSSACATCWKPMGSGSSLASRSRSPPGPLVYVSSLALIAPAVARQLLGMVRGLGPAMRPRADQAEGASAVDAPPGRTCRRSASRRRRAPSWPTTKRPVMGSSPRRRSRRISLPRALKIVS